MTETLKRWGARLALGWIWGLAGLVTSAVLRSLYAFAWLVLTGFPAVGGSWRTWCLTGAALAIVGGIVALAGAVVTTVDNYGKLLKAARSPRPNKPREF